MEGIKLYRNLWFQFRPEYIFNPENVYIKDNYLE